MEVIDILSGEDKRLKKSKLVNQVTNQMVGSAAEKLRMGRRNWVKN